MKIGKHVNTIAANDIITINNTIFFMYTINLIVNHMLHQEKL
jgi:hypothetical protein